MKKILSISILALAIVIQSWSQTTLTVYPDKDAMIRHCTNPSYINDQYTNYGDYGYYNPLMWTWSGYPVIYKSLIGIDLSQLPDNANITDAKLYLYATGNHVSNLTSGGGYKSNASYLRRIITSWGESTVTWDTAPTTVTNNQATLANSTAVDQDYVVDVTNLIKDIQANPTSSDGLMFGLVTEEYYAKMQFASSDHATSSMHPKLEITYTIGVSFPDYESFEFDDTKWEDTDGDNLDWTLRTGSTPSSSTGPSSAKQGKYYAYVEASYPNYPSKTAYLISPSYELDDKDNATLSFDYHMYGSNMGQLELSVSTNDGTSWSSSIWSKSGDQGNAWNSADVDLSSYLDETILLRFKATTGSSYRSDIALDNILVNATTEANPDDSENFIVTTTSLSDQGTSGAMQHTVQFFDGLGRPVQEIGVGSSLGGKDMVKPMEYDDYGRRFRDYLPFAAGDDENGTFRDYKSSGDDVLDMQEDFFQNQFSLGSDDAYAYSRTVFEESPMNRVHAQGAPGKDWSPYEETGIATDYIQEFEYENNAGSSVRCFTVNTSTDALQNPTSYYSANTLYKSTITDEDGNETEEFKDKLGKVVLKRTFEGANTLSTYYVYDDYGLLRYVIPPKALGDNGLPTTTVQDQLCYYYEYDDRNRMIEKKLPGVEPVYMVYDDRDRLVGTQDGELYNSNSWIMTKYDELNRPVITAKIGFSTAVSQTTVQGYINTFYNTTGNEYYEEYTSSGYGYTDQSYPDISSAYSSDLLTITFYDSYSFLSLSQFTGLGFDNTDNIDAYEDGDGTSNGYFDLVQGQVTGTSTMIQDGDDDIWIQAAMFYDDKYRVIQTQTDLFPSGESMLSSEYDFSGKVLQSLEIQTVNSVENKILYTYTYDHANRLLDTYVHYNTDDAIVLAQNQYDELGQLKKKKLHSDDNSDFTESVDYAYNIRGWLTSINNPGGLGDDKFGMQLFYQNATGSPNTTALYNGNISGISWAHNGGSIEGYAFDYDELNRLEAGDYKTYSASTWSDPTYFETSYSYDLNGNISALSRDNSSGTEIDDLTYSYVGNQLDYINDAGTTAGVNNTNSSGTDYTYDDNGNMVWDKNKDIEIDYNYLNLPEKIEEESGTGDELLYIYDANGIKWMKQLTDGSTITKTMYAGSFVYDDNDGDAIDDFALDYILNPEGVIDKLTSSVEYHYHLKDHLGNTRVLFDGAGTVKQKTDYYPFGMTSYQYSSSNDNKYLYNGKEIQDELLGGINLDLYDYHSRYYDPALGRFTTMDPLADEFPSWTPYHYVHNNPIIFTDPTGMFASPIYDEDGNFLGTDDQGLQGQALVMNQQDFTQGMSHSEAVSKNLGAEGLTNLDAAGKLHSHYAGLKDRPDYDGFVTISEGISWAKQRPNTLNDNDPNNALYLNASKLDFGNLSVSNMENLGFSNGTKGQINLFDFVAFNSKASRASTYALGNTQMQLVNSENGTVRLFHDTYDWDYHNYPQELRAAGKLPENRRDKLIYRERQRTGLNDSHGFKVFLYGLGAIKTK
ncbi:MAG: DUF6443 domain-containing protein [Bacteroidota bacterium]|nr:DUF6443 domain-containing protein [Bacteroidota bacterium]